MGRREIKQYEYWCDWCQVALSEHSNTHIVKVGPCGLTDYYRDDEICERCFNKQSVDKGGLGHDCWANAQAHHHCTICGICDKLLEG